MNRRRMMTEGKVLPLLVFEYGKTALSAGNLIGFGANFLNGTIKIEPKSYKPAFINISGINFSRYKTLKIECAAYIEDYEGGYDLHICGFGEGEGNFESDYEMYQYAPAYSRIVTFDISKIKGEKLIKASANHVGTAYMVIKNIWLE